MGETSDTAGDTPLPTLEDMQHWTWVVGRAQQLLMQYYAELMTDEKAWERGMLAMQKMMERLAPPPGEDGSPPDAGATPFLDNIANFWTNSFKLWGAMLEPGAFAEPSGTKDKKDRRFADEQWYENPVFSTIRQSYLAICDQLLGWTDEIDGLDAEEKRRLRFATQNFLDAVSPTNFAFTNPRVMEKTIETRGENLLKGLEHMLADLRKGQLTHTDTEAFELGRNVAATPGKVVKETPLYQLIQYAPTTETVLRTPLVIFPPWINRFYILDLNEKKSFVKWAVDQGISVFMVSWKSADESMKDVIWDDYIAAQIDAMETVKDLFKVPNVHAIGYCVAGTTLAATLALLAARGQDDLVASATFFTAQVDFTEAGDLLLFTDEDHLELVEDLSGPGYLDGRYMAATFNMLRGRDLIWNYVETNYLLGEDYPPFDLLYWNGDTTNLPAKWHGAYLRDLYRDNKLVKPGAISVDGTPIDLGKVKLPVYIQAGREDHIAPPQSVWKLMKHFSGPKRFLLAGSGHIAGVVNPPAANKYQYWTCDKGKPASLDAFIAKAQEHPGSWWPDWLEWLKAQDGETRQARGARIPGKGRLKALEDAPGRYVKMR